MWDSMRGISTGGADERLEADTNGAEVTGTNFLDLTPTGFKITTTNGTLNAEQTYIYMTIRRPDPLVQKPQLATDVFAMTTGNGSSTIPSLVSNFPVDFFTVRQPAQSNNWVTSARLMQGKYINLNSTSAETALANATFDSNSGAYAANWIDSTYQGWLWKRHAGFDLVAYDGNSIAGRQLPHSLSQTPEMFWVRPRTGAGAANQNWRVYHKGLNGGTNPEQYYLGLDQTNAESSHTQFWNDTAPTSTHVTLGTSVEGNYSGYTYLMMLFASVDGISSVGSFTGSGSSRTITVGFQPRFIILKNTSRSNGWITFDTVRGWGEGADVYDTDAYMWLNDSAAHVTGGFNVGGPTSTGFSLHAGDISNNQSGDNYIYYCHA